MAYIQYQRRMLQVQQEVGLPAGGAQLKGKKKALGANAVDEKEAIRALAEAEEKARTENGLSREELKAIDEMVREIIGKRAHAGDLFRADTLKRLEEMKARLPPDRRRDAEESIAQLKREQDEFSNLSAERKKYGDANVDAILAREAELKECWKEAMALFSSAVSK
jgi:muconolactone delta-isomerase